MLNLVCENPTQLWLELGRRFFSREWNNLIDIQLGDRRFISIGNNLIVRSWTREWLGTALFGLVGYSSRGYKMDSLRRTYVKEDKWKEFKKATKEESKGFDSKGMNFNMSLQKKGGCLSSLHLIRSRNSSILFVHGKIAEIPRKFVADMVLVKDLLQELSIWPMEVRFMYSVMYYSIVGLRAFVPVIGSLSMDLHGLPITEPRNYQAGIIEAINKYQERFSKKEKKEGIWKRLDPITGDYLGKNTS